MSFGRDTRLHLNRPLQAFLLLLLLFALGCMGKRPPEVVAERGEFSIVLHESGSVAATRSIMVSAPRMRVDLRIQYLIDEGTNVVPGDTLLIFDQAEVKKSIETAQADLDIAQANLRKGQAQLENELENLRSALTYDSTSWKLAQLRLERTRFESEVSRQEAELQFNQATLSLEQSVAKYHAQIAINDEELHSLELKVQQARAELDEAVRDFNSLVITAHAPGMVVCLPSWRGDKFGKLRVGDTPWRGQALLELPDFSAMQVDLQINEMDLNLVSKGDSCDIVLDAWPDQHFSASVTDISVLATEHENQVGIKSFDVVASFDEASELLKPGMNARCTIFGQRLPDVISLPVECLKRDEAGWYVWALEGGEYLRREVSIGATNGDRTVVEDGVSEGDHIALVDPEAWAEQQASGN